MSSLQLIYIYTDTCVSLGPDNCFSSCGRKWVKDQEAAWFRQFMESKPSKTQADLKMGGVGAGVGGGLTYSSCSSSTEKEEEISLENTTAQAESFCADEKGEWICCLLSSLSPSDDFSLSFLRGPQHCKQVLFRTCFPVTVVKSVYLAHCTMTYHKADSHKCWI